MAFSVLAQGTNNLIGLKDIPYVLGITFNGLIYHWMLIPSMRLEPNGTISSIIGNLSIF